MEIIKPFHFHDLSKLHIKVQTKNTSPSIMIIIAAATILALLIHAPTSSLAVDPQFLDCSTTFNCGNISGIGYPFWTSNRPPYCGYPGTEFQLLCGGAAAEITIMKQTYKLLQIHSDDKALTVARNDYPSSLCLTSNATLDYTIFDYTPDSANLTLFSGCTDIYSDRIDLDPAEVNCGDSGYGYYATAGNGVYDYLGGAGCARRVVVPFNKSAFPNTGGSVVTVENAGGAIENGFGVNWYAYNEACDACVLSGGACGHHSTSDAFACYCTDKPYTKTCGVGKTAFSWKFKLIIGATTAAIAIFFSCIIMVCIIKGTSLITSMLFPRKLAKQDQNVEAFIRNHGLLAPTRHNYSQVKRITNNFKDKLGEGGFGAVYKGKLPNGRLVAVKVLKSSKGNGDEFINEVASISRTSHVNIVSLLGYCFEGHKKALIYEFMPNGSLEKFIFSNDPSMAPSFHLDWEKLYHIATGIARGLEYLHRGCNTRILHFDIKPHNILLDKDFCPRIADFGLAKLCLGNESVISMLGARGTIGYIAPELCCRIFGGVSHKSDVYSYGMMILEMVGGRKNLHVGVSNTSEIYFPDWIYNQLEEEKDVKLHGVVSGEDNAVARKMILVGLWCIQTNPSDRPSMRRVIEMLEGSTGTLPIPPKPSLSSPARAPMDSSIASSQETSISVL